MSNNKQLKKNGESCFSKLLTAFQMPSSKESKEDRQINKENNNN